MSEPQLFDTPHTQIDADMAQQRVDTLLDVAKCNIFSVHMPMNEYERRDIKGLRFDQWPSAIQMRMSKEVTDWQDRQGNSEIKAITQGIENDVCILALHWRPKA